MLLLAAPTPRTGRLRTEYVAARPAGLHRSRRTVRRGRKSTMHRACPTPGRMPGIRRLAAGVLISAFIGLPDGTARAEVAMLLPEKDNTLYEDPGGALSNGTGVFLFAGEIATGGARRAVIAFDVAGAIPAGSVISSATLSLHMSRTIAGPESVALHALSAEWGEGASDAPAEESAGAPSALGDA